MSTTNRTRKMSAASTAQHLR
uniref:Uncharacterized protein n=1 Tax=Arundo donax TaxID=35708 RepID=A0A0A9DEQ5_ARUDO